MTAPCQVDRLTAVGMKYRRFESYFIILFLSPHSHIPSKIGMSDFPRSVKLYSTFGGFGDILLYAQVGLLPIPLKTNLMF